jgi:hypothetical protein
VVGRDHLGLPREEIHAQVTCHDSGVLEEHGCGSTEGTVEARHRLRCSPWEEST